MDDFAGSADAIAEKLVAGGMDPQQAMMMALRMAQSRQQADQSILGGVPTQPPVSDVPPATEILGGDPSKLFQRQPTTMERIKDLPKDVLGAADAMASMGSLAALAVPSMLYALRPGQKTQGDPMEFALRNMYMPRSERGPSHLAGLGEVLESLPQTGPLPELQAFTGIGRGVGRQLAEKGRQAGRAMAPAAANVAEDILSRQGLLMQAAPSGPTRVEAPASSLGFYDPVHQAALNIQRKQGPGQAFLNELQRSENVNKEFLEASGLAEKLRTTPNITREEVQSLAKGAVPEIQEVVYGNTSPEATQLRRQIGKLRDNLIAAKEDFQNSGYLFREIRGNDMINALPEKWQYRYDRIANMQRQYDELVDQEANLPSAQPTKYANYQLPGGENYREVLLTIPIDKEKYARSLIDPAVWSRMSEEQRAEFMNAPIRGGAAGTFKSAHWEEPNVVSHIRMNDRTDADGKKVLFIEEIQSDWAQEGRKKGFSDPKIKPVSSKQYDAFTDSLFDDYINQAVSRGEDRQVVGRAALHMRFEDLAKALGKEDEYQRMRAGRDLDESGEKLVPSAPFVQNTKEWVDLSLKNIIKRAVDEGYDRVAFVNGTQSADRYDLSKQVESISYQDRGDGTYRIIAAAKDRGVAIPEQTVSKDKLADVVGQEVAKKIVSGEGKEFPAGSVSEGMKSLSGLDLQVGGEGMKAFYDKLVPERVNAILKRFGGGKATMVPIQVGEPGAMVVPHGNQWAVQYEDGGFRPVRTKEEAEKIASTQKANQIGFDITPAMRERFQKPIPYKQGGSVNHKAVASARRALEKAMAKGGIAKAVGKAAAKAAVKTEQRGLDLERLKTTGIEVPEAGFSKEDKAVLRPLYNQGLIRVEERDGKKILVPGKGAWYEFATPEQRTRLDALQESQGVKDLSLMGPTESLLNSAQASFYDFEIVPGVRNVPIQSLEPLLPGYESAQEMKRIQNLANQIKESKQIEPLFIGVDPTGIPYIMEGQHRIRALKSLGYEDVPARIVVDMDEIEKAVGGTVKMAGGGSVLGTIAGKAAAAGKKSTQWAQEAAAAKRAPAKSKEEIEAIARRMAAQTQPGFVRASEEQSINPAGKSQLLYEMEQRTPMVVESTIADRPVPNVDYEQQLGKVIVGVPGDPTMGQVAVPGSLDAPTRGGKQLVQVGDVRPETPVQLYGGPRYGANLDETFWASNLSPARAVQNLVQEMAQKYGAEQVLGKYIKMSPESSRFAMHNLDALISVLQPEKLDKDKVELLNNLVRKGNPKHKFPEFAGFEDPINVLLQAQMNSKLRKQISEVLEKPSVAKQVGFPFPGKVVQTAITEPELRNVETGVTGFAMGKMNPEGKLSFSSHPTYDYDIPGQAIGRSKYLIPSEMSFPDFTAWYRSRPDVQAKVDPINMMKSYGPRQVIDQQYIDEIKMYEEAMKRLTGKKKGGLMKKSSKLPKVIKSGKVGGLSALRK